MKKFTYSGENDTINKFIVDVVFIEHLRGIIEKLKGGEFGGLDVKYLDKELHKYTLFSCSVLGIDFHGIVESGRGDKIMNDYIKNQYVERFTTLLKFFESVQLE